ncbi:MAG TPA: carbohydrate kinase [Rudaea sp.]|nr:carbohydrate kinase [Rudaea sp.]
MTGTIVCFGEALIDFLARPADGRAARTFAQFAGGAPANVAVAAARLGAPVHFVGMLARDMFGDFLLDSLRDAGVGTEYVVRTDAANTALAFVALDAHGERNFSFYRPPAADLLFRDEHFRADCFAAARVFHVCSNSLTDDAIAAVTLAGVRRARAAGALVSVDLNLRPALWPEGVDPTPLLWELLREGDVVKLAHNELAYLAERGGGEQAVVERLLGDRAHLVVVTHGAADVRWHTPAGAGEVRNFRVRVIDTTAAGDAFVGGLLHALHARGVDARTFGTFVRDRYALHAALRFATATGALSVTRYGAFESMPTRSEVERLLADQHEPA